ncbi:MAG TPA: gamma-glutamyl-gamma-aminobutyrate hydrolase family protein [Humisphaera sp.]
MNLLFVYGTLTPGRAPDCVADLVARFRPLGPATVRGTLFDLGSYPGLALGGDGVVRGTLVEVPAAEDDALWRRLDAYEGFDPCFPAGSLFRRVGAVAALEGGRTVQCQTYIYGRPADPKRAVPGGDWFARRDLPAHDRPIPDRPNPDMPAPQTPSRRRPLIGITTGYVDEKPTWYESPSDYARSVERAGGLPVLLPFRTDLSLVPDLLDAVDGVLFSGGNDLDPGLFGQTWHPNAVPIDPARQSFELALIAEAERRRTPSLGVCLGSQLMNVHRGGSLHQFLPDLARPEPVEHRHLGDRSYRHPVRIEPGTVLAAAYGRDGASANSRHKQAIDRLGRGLRVNAVAPDGVVEGVEDPSLPLFLGVQWHPENLTADQPEHLAPFLLLVRTAAAARAS